MKLYALSDVGPVGRGYICRQGRLMGTINALAMGGVFGGAPIVWWFLGAPWPVWVVCGVLAVFIVPLLINDLRAKFRETNWIVWLRPDGLWINFRSYQDCGPIDVPSVVKLEYAEIALVRKHVEKFSTPSSRGSTQWKVQSLELELTHDRTEELQAALTENRNRKSPPRNVCGISVSSRPSHFPVGLPESNCIRIAWRGGIGNWVAPSLGRFLIELAGCVRISEPESVNRPAWHELSDEQLDDQILELARSGARIEAVKLLVRARGYSLTEAREFIEELTAKA